MPDVIVWMLSGNTRVAYHRIPAYHLLYSDDDEARGMYCRKVLDIELKVRKTFFTLVGSYLMLGSFSGTLT